MTEKISPVWQARPPAKWAAEPTWMSISTLMDIEACPRRWSLSNADYSEIWGHRGYPTKPLHAVHAGRIIHNSLEVITKELTRAACSSVKDSCFTSVMRKLGGYSKVIESCITKLVAELKENPRAAPYVRTISQKLRTQIPDLRERLQALVSKLILGSTGNRSINSRDGLKGDRRVLPNGSYAEVELRSPEVGWRGFVDYLHLSESGCEIVEFKTGAVKPEHEFQTHVYNMLWMRDVELNPSRRKVSKISVAYPTGDIEVSPLSDDTLPKFEQDLLKRTRGAIDNIKQDPPPARPKLQNCSFCPVRQMCAEYWLNDIQEKLKAEAASEVPSAKGLVDVEVRLLEKQDVMNWTGKVLVCPEVEEGTTIHIRFHENNLLVVKNLCAGMVLRLLDAYLMPKSPDESTDQQLLIMGRNSESFLVSQH